MQGGLKFLKLARYYSSVTLLYGGTLLFIMYLFNPGLFAQKVQSQPITNLPLENKPETPVTKKPARVIKMGKPVRLEVPKIDRDIRVMEGHYNERDGSWTLRDGRLETYFAMPSALANDTGGNTIIYGHSNRQVFSPLYVMKPGDKAHVYTENGYRFTYTFVDVAEVKPNNTGLFTLEGPPQLILQTCTGNWYEKRAMYRFTFTDVQKYES